MPEVVDPNALGEFAYAWPGPYQIQLALVDWLRQHFGDPQNLVLPAHRNKAWKSTATAASLVIEKVTSWDREAAGKRPAVLVRRDLFKTTTVGIGRTVQGGVNLDGVTELTAQVAGTLTAIVASALADEAELLGGEVYRELFGFGPAIRDELGLLRFEVGGVSDLAKLEESTEHWAVEIPIAYGLEEQMLVRAQAPPLKTLGVKFVTQ